MNLNEFLDKLHHNADALEFTDTMAVIEALYQYPH